MAVPKKKDFHIEKEHASCTRLLTAPGISTCPQCQEPKQPHRVCENCGTYKGKEIISSEA